MELDFKNMAIEEQSLCDNPVPSRKQAIIW